MGKLLQEFGYVVTTYRHRAINTGATNKELHHIKSLMYGLVYVEFPVVGMHVPKKSIFAFFTTICNWARMASELRVPLIIFGPYGDKWKEIQLETLLEEKTLSMMYHRCCFWGIKLNPRQREPSSANFVTASTCWVQRHLCKCGLSLEEHKLDWKSGHTAGQK